MPKCKGLRALLSMTAEPPEARYVLFLTVPIKLQHGSACIGVLGCCMPLVIPQARD